MISETELRERLERHFEAGDGVGCVTCCATAAIALVREVEAAHAEEIAKITAPIDPQDVQVGDWVELTNGRLDIVEGVVETAMQRGVRTPGGFVEYWQIKEVRRAN